MAEKGQWSIVNPAGEEVSFTSREDLRKAVLDDEIEPHAESIPPEEPARISRPVDEGEAELVAERLSDPEVKLAASELRSRDGASSEAASGPLPPLMPPPLPPDEAQSARMLMTGEGDVADDIEAAPPSLGDLIADEPTLQFTKPLSAPPTATRASPPEDEGSPLSLSEVDGTEDTGEGDAPADRDDEENAARVSKAKEEDAKPQVAKARPSANGVSAHAQTDEEGELADVEDIDDETSEIDAEAIRALEAERAIALPNRGARVTTPPPLPVAPIDGRASRPSIPDGSSGDRPLAASEKEDPPLAASETGERRSSKPSIPPPLPPRPSRISPPPRGSLSSPLWSSSSLPPPDIVPDFSVPAVPAPTPPALGAEGSAARTGETHAVQSPAKTATKKPSVLVPVALIAIGFAFWLGTRSNHPPAANTEVANVTQSAVPSPPAAPSSSASASSAAPAPPETASSAEQETATEKPVDSAEMSSASSAAPSASSPAPSASALPATSAPKITASPPVADKPRAPVTTSGAGAAGATPAGPEGVAATLRRAAAVQRTGDFGQAREIYLTLLQKEPHNAEVLSGLGDTSRALGDKVSAKSYYIRALDASSSFMPALLGLADTEWDLGERPNAMKHYQDFIEHNPNAPDRAQKRARGIVVP